MCPDPEKRRNPSGASDPRYFFAERWYTLLMLLIFDITKESERDEKGMGNKEGRVCRKDKCLKKGKKKPSGDGFRGSSTCPSCPFVRDPWHSPYAVESFSSKSCRLRRHCAWSWQMSRSKGSSTRRPLLQPPHGLLYGAGSNLPCCRQE